VTGNGYETRLAGEFVVHAVVRRFLHLVYAHRAIRWGDKTKRNMTAFVKRSWIAIDAVAEPVQTLRDASCGSIIAFQAFLDLV